MNITKHGQERLQQRGISISTLDFILQQGDRRQHLQRGVTAVVITRKGARRLIDDGFAPALVSKTQGIAALVAPSGDLVTCFRLRQRLYKHH